MNLIAAAAVAASAFLQWFNGALPAATEAHAIAGFVPVSVSFSRATIATHFSVSIALFVAAGLFAFAGLFAKKLFTLFGVALTGAILAFWFLASGFNLSVFASPSNFQDFSVFGIGVFAAAGGVIIGLLSFFIPKKHAPKPAS